MTVSKGRNLLLKVDLTGGGTYTTIAALQSKTVSINCESVEVSNFDSGNWRELDSRGLGIRSMAVSGSGIFVDDATQNFMEDAAFAHSFVTMQIVFENGDYYESDFIITSMDKSGELSGVEVFSLSLESARAAGGVAGGALTLTRPSTACVLALDTLSYSSVTLLLSGEETTPRDLTFNADGTKVYIIGSVQDTVFQYNLTTPYVVSSGAYSGNSLDISGIDTSGSALDLSSDGLTLYVLGGVNDTVYQFSLSTADDLSTAVDSGLSYDVSAETTATTGLHISSDGVKMFILSSSPRRVFQYTLVTAGNVSTSSYDSVSLPVNSLGSNNQGFGFSADGLYLYVVFSGETAVGVSEYPLADAWDISGASGPILSLDVDTDTNSPQSVEVSPDCTKLFIVDFTTKTIQEYS